MADYNVKEIAYGGNNYKMYPANLTSDTQLQNAAQDATETQDRVYPVRLDANGKLAVNVPWTSSGAQDMTGATETTAGTHGLVPAPAAGDQKKFLSGAGTWEIPVIPILSNNMGYVELEEAVTNSYTTPADGIYVLMCKTTSTSTYAYWDLDGAKIMAGGYNNGQRSIVALKKGTTLTVRTGSSYSYTVGGYFPL